MIKVKMGNVIVLTGLSATALYAAQPPNPSSVQSDAFYNTAMGPGALSHDVTPSRPCVPYALNQSSYYMSGCGNTASGFGALDMNTTGAANAATGAGAMFVNTTGSYNAAFGTLAMFRTVSGSYNSALGTEALFSNTTGNSNTASGSYALYSNDVGNSNAAAGYSALFSNTSGGYNTASGNIALTSNTTGSFNSASGNAALHGNTTGTNNTATGNSALVANTSGAYNTADGAGALQASTTGIGNTALGFTAGNALTTGNYNTYIGYGVTGISTTDNYVTQIGVSTLDPNVSGTPTTYISGIYNTPLSGNPVVVTSTGQLGVVAVSSERFKTGIETMGSRTARLAQLRPVTFRLRTDAQGTVQYGLIAEEVDKVYPELVIRDGNGRIDGVRYDELAPMLLNEVQKEHNSVATLVAQREADAAKIASLEQQVAKLSDLEQEMRAALRELGLNDQLVVKR